MQYGLDAHTISAIQNVFACFPQIDEAVIYGSRAKDNFKPGSDIDLTLKGSKLNIKTIGEIEQALDALSLPYTFDLSIFHQIENEALLEHIKQVGKRFYTAEIHLQQFESGER